MTHHSNLCQLIVSTFKKWQGPVEFTIIKSWCLAISHSFYEFMFVMLMLLWQAVCNLASTWQNKNADIFQMICWHHLYIMMTQLPFCYVLAGNLSYPNMFHNGTIDDKLETFCNCNVTVYVMWHPKVSVLICYSHPVFSECMPHPCRAVMGISFWML